MPFLRSEETATDTASTWDTVEEVLADYRGLGQEFDSFCVLQPTSPLRTAEDLINAYKLYEEKSTFAVVSVCEAEHSPLWCGHLPPNGEFIDFIDQSHMKQRQAGGKFYRLNGAIYIVNVERFKRDRYLYQKGSFAYVMDQSRSVDIDTELDFELVEFLLNRK